MPRGGPNRGQGRKPEGDSPKVPIAFKLAPEIVTFLRSQENATATLESLIRRSKGFREWSKNNS